MRKLLRKILEVNEQEEKTVYLLLLSSFFLGVFLATFDVTASSLFVDTFEESFLPYGFAASGILGIIGTTLFTFFQQRFPFYKVAMWNIIFTFLITMTLAIGLEIAISKELIFLSFAFMTPLNANALLGFYGMVSRSFNLRDEKRITGKVDQGQMIALTIAFFIFLVIESLITDLASVLFVSGFSILLVFFLNLVLTKSLRGGDNRLFTKVKFTRENVAKTSYLINNKYVFSLVLLVVFTGIAAVFIEFSFLSVVADQYDDDKTLARFLALYGAVLTIFSFLLDAFAGEAIMKNYGMRVSLLILPIILASFTALAALSGTFMGFDQASGTALYFFLFIAMSKLFYSAAKNAFEDPVLKTLFLPLDSNIRLDAQAKIEGVTAQAAAFIGAGILAILGFFHFVNLVFFSYVLILVFVAYGLVVLQLYREYRNTLTDKLAGHSGISDVEVTMEYEVSGAIKKQLKSKDVGLVINSMKMIERIDPISFEEDLGRLIGHESPAIRKFAMERISHHKTFVDFDSLRRRAEIEEQPEIKELALAALKNIDSTDSAIFNKEKVLKLVKSRNVEDRIEALAILSNHKSQEIIPFVYLLLKDNDKEVRLTAILTTAKLKRPELWPVLVENLGHPDYGPAAMTSLALSGDEVLLTLEGAFYKSGQNFHAMIRIIQIYGRIASDSAIKLLWNKIDYPDTKIVNQVFISLSATGYIASPDKEMKVKQAIEDEISKVAWNIAALSEVSEMNYAEHVREALKEEIAQNRESVYMLLTLLYDAQSVMLVKENIESGTVEGLVYAVELLDVFLADDIKPKLFPLVEDISQADRNFRLQNYFPREDLDQFEVLHHIINRDYNYSNRYTKACALYGLFTLYEFELTSDVVANIFNPDPILRELAAASIYTKDITKYRSILERIPGAHKKELMNKEFIFQRKEVHFSNMLIIEKVFYLKELTAFKNIPGSTLYQMMLSMREEEIPKDYVLEQIGVPSKHNLYVVISGALEITALDNQKLILKERELFDALFLQDTDNNEYEVKAHSDTIVMIIEGHRLVDLISSKQDMARDFLAYLSKVKSEENSEKIEENTI